MLVLSFLSNFDLFQNPVKVYFNGRSKLSSSFGIFVSFSLYGFLLFSFINSDLFKKEEPIIITQSLQMPKAEPVQFDSNIILTFAIVDFLSNRYWDPTYFSIVARYTYGSNFMEKELKSCAVEANNQGGRIGAGFNNTMCLLNDTFTLEGSLDGSVLSYLALNVLPCNNKTSNNTCKTMEEINAFIDTFPLTKYFAVRYHNAKTDLNNYEQPFKWNSEIDAEYINSKVQRAWKLYFKNAEIETDDGWFFSSKSTLRDIMIDKKTTDFRLRAQDTDSFFTVALFASKDKYISSRRYKKIPEVLAEISGLTQFFIIIFGVLTRFAIHVGTLDKMMNKLYAFPKSEKKRKRAKSNRSKKNDKSKNKDKKLKAPNHKDITTLNNNPNEIIANTNTIFDPKNIICEITSKKKLNIQEDTIKSNDVFVEMEKKVVQSRNENESPRGNSNKLYPRRIEPKVLIEEPIISERFSLDKENVLEKENNCQGNKSHFESKTKLANDQNLFISCEISRNLPESSQKNFPTIHNVSMTKDRKQSLFSKFIEKSREFSQKLTNRSQKNINKTKQTHNFKLSMFDYLCFLWCKLLEFIFKRKLSEFHEKIRQAERNYKNDLDSMNIVQKTHDLEKLKMLVLNEDQLILFNFLPKFMINSSSKEIQSSNKITDLLKRQSPASNCFDASYQRVLKNEDNNEINRRLIYLLDMESKKT